VNIKFPKIVKLPCLTCADKPDFDCPDCDGTGFVETTDVEIFHAVIRGRRKLAAILSRIDRQIEEDKP